MLGYWFKIKSKPAKNGTTPAEETNPAEVVRDRFRKATPQSEALYWLTAEVMAWLAWP
jgi:hypothetical protein